MRDSHNEKVFSSGWDDYELIDAGGSQKLERWGKIYTIRPERQAYFKSGMTFAEWDKLAHWKFTETSNQKGTWKSLQPAPKEWEIEVLKCRFKLELTQFKHIGLFPEQFINWQHIQKSLRPEDKMLNLFAYTGASSIIAKSKGADTYHVDSVKQLINWAKINMELSGLKDIKWVLEDALKFAQREVKRGNTYRLIQMDPPAWGIGAKGEKWKLENKIEELISIAFSLLENKGTLIINTYSPRIELQTLKGIVESHKPQKITTSAELWQKTKTGKKLYYGDLIIAKK
ncbi:MAG: 23S rRNA (cytosine1962-C5)-methyltransferase [Psychromonas sp.]